MFHLHFDGGGRTFLHRFGGRNGESAQIHMGANRVQVYHGHSINTATSDQDWRVYGFGRHEEETQNARDGFDCTEVNPRGGRLWWVGRNLNWNDVEGLTQADMTWLTLVRDWGIRLYNDGIVGERAWRLIYPNARVVNERTGSMEVGERRPDRARSAVLRGSGGNGYVWYSSWLSDPTNGLRRYQDPPPL